MMELFAEEIAQHVGLEPWGVSAKVVEMLAEIISEIALTMMTIENYKRLKIDRCCC
jgi:hypothetical protein